MSNAILLNRLLDVIEHDVVPLTASEVKKGNKLFGAAILKKSDLSLVIAETNNEVENPLWHGEMHALKRLYERNRADIPDPKDCIFIATHEPCSLCLSAITWAGFDNFYYLFTYEDSRDSFAIPHDLNILKEVFVLPDGNYARKNAFWSAHSITEELGRLPRAERGDMEQQVTRLVRIYDEMSATYQASKDEGSSIPLAWPPYRPGLDPGSEAGTTPHQVRGSTELLATCRKISSATSSAPEFVVSTSKS